MSLPRPLDNNNKTNLNLSETCPVQVDHLRLITEVEAELQAAKSSYISTAYVFNSLLDGGNTDAVVEEVQESWPQDAWELRNYLMSRSPYLSTEVLVEMMKKNILPQAMVLEICLANPEATKKEGFIKWAEFEAPSPLPTYMINLIAGSWEAKTFRMQLEAQMGQHHAEMTRAADMLQASYRIDEEIIPLEDILAVWQYLPNYGARYAEAEVRLRNGEYSAARAVLNALANNYPMKEPREAERDRALWYIDRLEDLAVEGRNIMQLNEAEIATWQTFAETASDIPGGWVRNILCFGYSICPSTAGTAYDDNKSLHPARPESAPSISPALTLLPNPASTWVTFTYALNGSLDNGQIRVLDARGREVRSFAFNTTIGQELWDTREVPGGVYSVELLNGGQRLSIQRLVVQPTD